MVQDSYYEATDKLLKKLEFVTVNDKLKQDKAILKDYYESTKARDRMNFFPFTHGELVEKQREQINE